MWQSDVAAKEGCGRRLCQPPCGRVRQRDRYYKRPLGRLRQQAERREDRGYDPGKPPSSSSAIPYTAYGSTRNAWSTSATAPIDRVPDLSARTGASSPSRSTSSDPRHRLGLRSGVLARPGTAVSIYHDRRHERRGCAVVDHPRSDAFAPSAGLGGRPASSRRSTTSRSTARANFHRRGLIPASGKIQKFRRLDLQN